MRTRERLLGLKAWLQENLCAGRVMKTPGKTVQDILTAEPRVFLGWHPCRPEEAVEAGPQPAEGTEGAGEENPISTVPSILVMPNPSKGRLMEEKRFDRYAGVKRPQELGQSLAISMLLSVYEPGARLPGFAENGRMDKLLEGTEAGLFTLFDWMDELVACLLSAGNIPGTDLLVDAESIVYAPYTDQNYVVDKRPLFYGFVNVEFGCYAGRKPMSIIDGMLD